MNWRMRHLLGQPDLAPSGPPSVSAASAASQAGEREALKAAQYRIALLEKELQRRSTMSAVHFAPGT
ncbi:MAG: hypothetical protein VX152_12395, partial [Pseudomonadota bacterium]|nr:hypothetical protein [Pseudomonadota bacterium]